MKPTCFREISKGATECTPFKSLPCGIAVIKAGSVQRSIARLLFQAGTLRHTWSYYTFLLF